MYTRLVCFGFANVLTVLVIAGSILADVQSKALSFDQSILVCSISGNDNIKFIEYDPSPGFSPSTLQKAAYTQSPTLMAIEYCKKH